MVETATNDVGPSASIAANSAAPVATLRAAIASDEKALGLFLRVYEDLRDRIAQTRQKTYSEITATVISDLSTKIDQLETRVDSFRSECRSLRTRLAAAGDRVRDLESSPVSTAPLLNIPTRAPPVASVSYSIPIPPVNNAHTSQVGAASQTQTNPYISTPISRSNVCAAPPYPSSLPNPIIPNTMFSHPSPTSRFSVEICQHRRRRCIHHTHPRPYTRLIADLVIRYPRFPGLEPKRTLLPPFATVVSYETYRLHDKRTILAPSENLEVHRIKRKFEGLIPTLKLFNGTNPIRLLRYFAELRQVSISSEFPKALQSIAYTYFLRERPRCFTNHSLHE